MPSPSRDNTRRSLLVCEYCLMFRLMHSVASVGWRLMRAVTICASKVAAGKVSQSKRHLAIPSLGGNHPSLYSPAVSHLLPRIPLEKRSMQHEGGKEGGRRLLQLPDVAWQPGSGRSRHRAEAGPRSAACDRCCQCTPHAPLDATPAQ